MEIALDVDGKETEIFVRIWWRPNQFKKKDQRFESEQKHNSELELMNSTWNGLLTH